MVITREADLFCQEFVKAFEQAEQAAEDEDGFSYAVMGSGGIGKSCNAMLLISR
jgi:hypothetical protein